MSADISTGQKADQTADFRPYVKTANQILADTDKDGNLPTLLDPIMLQHGVISLAGSSDVGKSYLLLQLAVAVSNGEDQFLSFKLNTRSKSAIVISTEDDEDSLTPRLKNLGKRISPDSYDRLHFFTDSADLPRRLNDFLTDNPADLIVIDTFADVYEGDMNQSNKVRLFMKPFKELARKYKVLVIFNHHCGKKNDDRAPHKDNLLGSQGFESSMRCVLELRKDHRDSAKRHLCIVKCNYLSDEHKGKSYVLNFEYDTGFDNTDERSAFNTLVRESAPKMKKADRIDKALVIARLETGATIDQIHEELKAAGIDIGRSALGTLCSELRPSIQIAKEKVVDEPDSIHPSIQNPSSEGIDG